MAKPTVAIVGRPNVGKSTIFNRIAGSRISIVDDKPGVTRDRVFAPAEWLGTQFNLIDTGGIEVKDEPFIEQITDQAEIAIDNADAIIFMVNGKQGMTDADEKVARLLYKANKPVILAVNKIDNPEMKSDAFDFYSLGFGDPFPISGAHGLGLGDLLDEVLKKLPKEVDEEEDNSIKFSVIGEPNVGKSSIVNAILGENRGIVSSVSGTTRDAVDTTFDYDGTWYTIVDTAGIRKRGKVYENTERYSVMRAQKAINESSVVLMVIDAEAGIREQDKKVAGYAHEAGCGVIIVVNKWDAIKKTNRTRSEFLADIRYQFEYLAYAPIVFVSAKTGSHINQLLGLIKTVYENHTRRIPSAKLNDAVMDAIEITPTPTKNGKRLRVYYATQVATAPPTFVFFVNDPDLMHFSYKRYLDNQIRKNFDFKGTPIRLIARRRK